MKRAVALLQPPFCLMNRRFLLPAALAAGLCGVARADVPDWVLSPAAEPGSLAGAYCVRQSNSLALDRMEAIGRARAQIVEQIELRISALQETELSSGSGGTSKSFKNLSRQLAEQSLSELRVVRVESVAGADGRQLCVLVRQDRDKLRPALRNAAAANDLALDPGRETRLIDSIFPDPK